MTIIMGNKVIYNRNFKILVLSRFISVLGTMIFDFALGLYVLDITKSASIFSMIIGVAILPQGLVDIFGGVLVDKKNKKKIIVITEILSGIATLIFMVLFNIVNIKIYFIAICVILLNAFQGLCWLALMASIPNIVGKEKTTQANSFFQGIGAVTNILGPIIGAVAYKALGMNMICILDSLSFTIGGLLAVFLRYDVKEKNQENVTGSYIYNIKVVFKYINDNKIIKFFLIVALVVNLIYNPLMLVVLQYITYDVLKLSALQVSLIKAAGAMGIISGAVIVGKMKDTKLILQGFFSLLGIQAVLIIMWAFPSFPFSSNMQPVLITGVFFVLLLTYGALNTIQNLPVITFFQSEVPEELRARVFGILNSALLLSTPLGIWIYGILLQKMNWTYILWASGIIMIIMCFIFRKNRHYMAFINNAKDDKTLIEYESERV